MCRKRQCFASLFEQGIDVLQDEFIHTLVVLLLPVFQHEALQRKAGIGSLQQTVVPDKVFFLVPDKTVDGLTSLRVRIPSDE